MIPYTIERRADTGVTNVTMGIWLFIAAEVMLFGSLFSWRLVLVLTLCAFAGSYLESILGSWNRRQERPVPNGIGVFARQP